MFFFINNIILLFRVRQRDFINIVYIVEFIIKYFKKRKIKPEEYEIEENTENCKHVFLPIDSSSDYFACSLCGHVLQNTKNSANLQKRNIFKV